MDQSDKNSPVTATGDIPSLLSSNIDVKKINEMATPPSSPTIKNNETVANSADADNFFARPLSPFAEKELELPTGSRIGQDEAGKGDYFGPLVVASAYVAETEIPIIQTLGIKDSKLLSDEQNQKLAVILAKKLPHYILVLMPEDYNQVYFRAGTLNRLLALCHAQALENLLTIQSSPVAIVDQFNANKEMLENKLLEKGSKIQVIQTIHGERDLAVACASILARATFLQKLQLLRQQFKINFPKGANRVIFPTLNKFVRRYGKDKLIQVAKVHFEMLQPDRNFQFF